MTMFYVTLLWWIQLNKNSVLLRSKVRAAKWIIKKRWSQASDGLWLNCAVFVWLSESGPGAAPIPFSSRLYVNKLAHFDKKLYKNGRAGCGSTLLFHPHIDMSRHFNHTCTLTYNDLYWSQQPEQEKGRTCSYRRGMDKKRQLRREEVGRDRHRDGDDKGEEWGLK